MWLNWPFFLDKEVVQHDNQTKYRYLSLICIVLALLHFEVARSSRVAKLNSNEPKTCLPLLLQLIKPPFMLRNTFYADNPFGAPATVAGTPEPELDNVTDKRWKYLCNKVRRFRLKCGRVRGYNFIVCLLVHFLAFQGIYCIWSIYEGCCVSTFLRKFVFFFWQNFHITQLWPEPPLLQSLLYGLVIPSSGRLPVYPQSRLIFQDGFNLFRRTLDNLMSSSSSNRMNNAPNTQDKVLWWRQ